MRILLHLFSFGLLAIPSAYAQTPDFKSSVGVSIESIGLDAPDGLSKRYVVGYTRHWHNDRLVLHNDVGYVSALNRRYLVNNFYVDGNRRQRVTGDITLAFDFINHPRHAFRLGVGPSFWYRKDQQLDGASFTLSSTGEVSNVITQWRTVEEVNYGFNVLGEYEFALTNQLLLRGNLKFASLKSAGLSTIYGAGLGYRLRRK